nr:hypothetical protein [Tanacetum cinerariifolium]
MPKYAKFMKDLLARKGKIEETSKIVLNERCSAVLLNKIPFKEKDLGSFTIPYVIGKVGIDKALADIGANISLMPYSMYVRLDLVRHIKEDHKIPIILGRQFLATTHAMIDVFNKKISFDVRNETITFDIKKSMKFSTTEDVECLSVDLIDNVVSDLVKEILLPIDYVSKWVEAEALPTNDARVVVKFLRKLFSRFEVPKALISDRETHFCNSLLEKTLRKYGVTHRVATPYHPQTSGQTKSTNRAIKCILKRTVNGNRKE